MANMPHGNKRSSFDTHATEKLFISKDGQKQWLSFEM